MASSSNGSAPLPIWRCKCGYWERRNGDASGKRCPYCYMGRNKNGVAGKRRRMYPAVRPEPEPVKPNRFDEL